LAGALAVTPGLVRIDLAHPFEQFFRARLIDFGGAGPFAATAAAWRDGSVFLSLVRHTTRFTILPSARFARGNIAWRRSRFKVQSSMFEATRLPMDGPDACPPSKKSPVWSLRLKKKVELTEIIVEINDLRREVRGQ
jgi:hypothetical protein